MRRIYLLYKKLPAALRTTLELVGICLVLLTFVILKEAADSHGGIAQLLFALTCVVLSAMPYLWKKFKTWREHVAYEKHFLLYRNHAKTITRQGSLEAYYEHGWEGDFLQSFNPDQRPGDPKACFPMVLGYGDHLTVYSKTNEIVWQGIVFDKGSSRWKLPGARPVVQPMWFWESYRAELIRLPDGLHGSI